MKSWICHCWLFTSEIWSDVDPESKLLVLQSTVMQANRWSICSHSSLKSWLFIALDYKKESKSLDFLGLCFALQKIPLADPRGALFTKFFSISCSQNHISVRFQYNSRWSVGMYVWLVSHELCELNPWDTILLYITQKTSIGVVLSPGGWGYCTRFWKKVSHPTWARLHHR